MGVREAILEGLAQVGSMELSPSGEGWERGKLWEGSCCPECQPDPKEGGLSTLHNLQNPRNLPGGPVPFPSQRNPVTTHQIPEREYYISRELPAFVFVPQGPSSCLKIWVVHWKNSCCPQANSQNPKLLICYINGMTDSPFPAFTPCQAAITQPGPEAQLLQGIKTQ